jgi:MFS family permease
MVWIIVPERKPLGGSAVSRGRFRGLSSGLKQLIRLPSIWLLAGIIVCAYSGYKATDVFSLYAVEVLGTSELAAAGIGTSALWIRALVAVLAGLTGDRLGSRKVIAAGFGLTALGAILTGLGYLEGSLVPVLLILGFTAVGIYAVRALYFSILREAGVPLALTGMAVGIVSFLGFTPEIFMSPWMGHLLDSHPGPLGHRLVFFLLAGFSTAGMILSILFSATTRPSR